MSVDKASNTAVGSARAPEGYDLGALMAEAMAQKVLIGGGGHARAAGFTVDLEKLDEFIAFVENFYQHRPAAGGSGKINFDAQVHGSLLGKKLLSEISLAEPFGFGNPKPRFLVTSCEVIDLAVRGDDHLQISFRERDGTTFRAMLFRVSQRAGASHLKRGQVVDLLVTLNRNDFRGKARADIFVEDLRAQAALAANGRQV